MAFRFRQFIVEDGCSTMPVGTDAMLLGAWTDPAGSRSILDIGTGCGVLALMMAQRSDATVTAVDIDPGSVAEAARNFAASPWPGRLTAMCADITATDTDPGRFDLVVSNPPFFAGSLKPPDERRTLARHGSTLSIRDFPAVADRFLAPTGRFALVVPADAFDGFRRIAENEGFRLYRMMTVRSFREQPPVRVLCHFAKSPESEPERQELIIFDAPGKFSAEYLELTSEFHFFK